MDKFLYLSRPGTEIKHWNGVTQKERQDYNPDWWLHNKESALRPPTRCRKQVDVKTSSWQGKLWEMVYHWGISLDILFVDVNSSEEEYDAIMDHVTDWNIAIR